MRQSQNIHEFLSGCHVDLKQPIFLLPSNQLLFTQPFYTLASETTGRLHLLCESLDVTGQRLSRHSDPLPSVIQDQLAADMYNFFSKEGDYARYFVTVSTLRCAGCKKQTCLRGNARSCGGGRSGGDLPVSASLFTLLSCLYVACVICPPHTPVSQFFFFFLFCLCSS